MNENQPWEFTCKTCGGHELNVSRVWEILAGPESELWQEWGLLEADHHWRYKFKEQIKKTKSHEEEELFQLNFSAYTKDISSSKPEEYEIFEPHSNPGNDMFYVNCTNCDREVKFGWERPDRGGGIYPVECSDFMPGEIWPEPRYLDFWHQNHWLKEKDG